MTTRAVIIARIKPGCEEKVAAIFAQSDATELPKLAGVKHRSLFVFGDIYIHLIETETESGAAVENVRDHPLFREISKNLEPYISPYNPETWRSPKDAMARAFYQWDAETLPKTPSQKSPPPPSQI